MHAAIGILFAFEWKFFLFFLVLLEVSQLVYSYIWSESSARYLPIWIIENSVGHLKREKEMSEET